MSQTLWFLKRCNLFERLSSDELQQLEHKAVTRRFKRREVIYFPGDPGDHLLVLLRGRVKLKSLTPDGKEAILAFIGEGEIFGELALIDEATRHEFAEAVEDVQSVAIPAAAMLEVMQKRADLCLHVVKLVGLRRRRIENRFRNVLFRSNRERVLRLLLELLQTHGRKTRDGWEIRLRLSHQDLANLIGTTRESVTLTLGQLQHEGKVRIARKELMILDRDSLAAEVRWSTADADPEANAPVLWNDSTVAGS
jgi:CRP-like cAMP-binding protein